MSGGERGLVRTGDSRRAIGGFLSPPTHPEHHSCVETDLRRRPENRGAMSLSAAVECEWLDAATRAQAKRVLDSWERPPLDRADVQEWIAQVLGYFRNCYRGPGEEPDCWNAANVVIRHDGDPHPGHDRDVGVHWVRKFYPEFQPSEADFARAHWGAAAS